MMKTLRWIVFAALFTVPVVAEIRLWTDENGTLFEGEFSRRLLGRIHVRGTDGKLHMISEDQLVKADLVYLQNTIAPDFSIQVSKKSRVRPQQEWSIDGDFTTFYNYTVKLTKRGQADSRVRLTAELYVIADEVDGENWVLAERGVSSFVFPDGKDSEHEFTVENIPFREYYCSWAESEDRPRGIEHAGYFLAILDSKGNVVDSDTNMRTAEWMDHGEQAVADKLRALYLQGRGSQFSRHFDQTIEKTKVPRLPWFPRINDVGRI